MTDRVEVKTKAAAEKALKAGKPIRIVSGRFALALSDMVGVDISISAKAEIKCVLTNVQGVWAQKDYWSSRVEAWGSSRVEARGSSSVEAWGSSRVEAWENSRVVAWENSRVEAWGSSRVEARGSSSVVVAWGSSRVVARGSSSVEARGSSSVVAWGSSRVVAWGYTFLDARSTHAKLTARPNVSVNLWNGATCDGGRQQIVDLKTAEDWCDYYGVRTESGLAYVYKAVGENYLSRFGSDYTPGTMPTDSHWNGKKGECERGCGLNFSPTPRHTREFEHEPVHYLECAVRLDEMVVHFDGRFPQKCTAQRVAAPLIECDIDGNHIRERVVLKDVANAQD